MNSYSKIVFGLKHGQRLADCRTFTEVIHSLHIIISEHNADTDHCERPGLHYHGIIEHDRDTDVNVYDAIVKLKTFCTYFKIEKCNFPEQLVVDLVQPPKQVMILEIWKSSNLRTYYSAIPDFASVQLERGHYEQEFDKMIDMKLIMSNMLNRRIFDPVEVFKLIENAAYYISTPKELKNLITNSIALLQQKILDQSILILCDGFLKWSANYYSVQESTDLILEWCRHQNIDVEAFIMNLVRCLDKQVSHRNSIYFQGSSESGINSIIRSLADACCFVGEIDNECTGYTYVWEDCLEKRCIIMRDPVFNEFMFEELENILSGNGAFVPHRQSTLKYLRPTPVLVISGENDGEHNLYVRLQNCFLQRYVNLKPFGKLHSDSRPLHPDWLIVLYKHFIGPQIVTTVSSSEDTLESSMDSELSYDEYELITPVAPVPSTIPFVGIPNPRCSEEY